MKRWKRALFILTLVPALLLSACGGGSRSGTGGEGPIRDLVTWQVSSAEVSNLFILNTESGEDVPVLCNLYSSLLEVDNKGNLIPAIAAEWGSDDGGLTWRFRLREDVTWVDADGAYKADCTAQDWITAMEWILNFHKNGGYNVSMPRAMIRGAQEYYSYTSGLRRRERPWIPPSFWRWWASRPPATTSWCTTA